MAEVGIDIASNASKTIADLARAGLPSFDLIIAVCDGAVGACPAMPGMLLTRAPVRRSTPTRGMRASEDEAMPHYRRVRDEIRDFVSDLPSLIDRHLPAAPSPHQRSPL